MCHTFLASLQQIFQNPLDDFHTQWYFSCKSHCSCGLVWTFPQDVVVFILNTATESGWLSPWDPPLPQGKAHERTYRPATHPIHFAAVSPDKIIAALHGRYFSFFTNKILCSCSIFQNLFLVVDCTTSKCYSYVWKMQNVVSALRPAFFILYLESFISRLNVIPCHDLTLSVGEPDNAAAKQGQELRSVWTVTPIHEQSSSTYFCVLIIRKHL